MTRDIIDINDFTILVEESQAIEVTKDACTFDEEVVAVAFYGQGDVNLRINYGDKHKEFNHTKGIALSFYADDQVEFEHTVSAEKPLNCIVICTSLKSLEKLPNQEGELFSEFLYQLTHPNDHYVEGPVFHMSAAMHSILNQLFNNQFEGKTRMMFFRSQITALLSHFFGELAQLKENKVNQKERAKIFEAKEILSNNLDTPPSLSELSKLIGLNSFKLKKNFKEVFGVPVFKYLQNERLTKAHELLRKQDFSVQEAAWQVGYDSLSSFSNAFAKKYGYRPSEIRA
ncbi:MAG: AraC family transcriptional regulator [Bacteroidota bacterium]